jgi:hypothetical protein
MASKLFLNISCTNRPILLKLSSDVPGMTYQYVTLKKVVKTVVYHLTVVNEDIETSNIYPDQTSQEMSVRNGLNLTLC